MSSITKRICDVCGGTGKLSVLSVKNTTGKTKPCPYCNGTGRDTTGGTMNIQEFAKLLDGRQYLEEISPAEIVKAKELGYIVVCGQSDDLCEIYGAFMEEYDCYDGGVIKDERLPKPITAVWCDKDRGCAWSYKTDMPYAEFNIFEDDELYCVGMVIDLKESKMSYKEAYEYLEDWDELNFCAKADAEAIETARQALLECIKDGKER